MEKKLYGAAAHSHQYYTVEDGEYDNNRRAEGALLLVVGIHLASIVGNLGALIRNAVKNRRNTK